MKTYFTAADKAHVEKGEREAIADLGLQPPDKLKPALQLGSERYLVSKGAIGNPSGFRAGAERIAAEALKKPLESWPPMLLILTWCALQRLEDTG